MNEEILIVSLGPGDPELLTIKALKALWMADAVFCPTTLVNGVESSRSLSILEAHDIDADKIECYHLPMRKDRTETLRIYASVAEQIAELHSQGKSVVITAEGDGGFFSSSQYVGEMLEARGIEVRRIAGVPAFIDCAALANMHIAKGDNALVINPYLEDIVEAKRMIEKGANMVCMKPSQSESNIKQLIDECADYAHFHYIENCGGEREYYTSDIETIKTRKFPYFAILIIESI